MSVEKPTKSHGTSLLSNQSSGITGNKILFCCIENVTFFTIKFIYKALFTEELFTASLVFFAFQDCVSEALLARLFDPVVSPRCYAIIAIKKWCPLPIQCRPVTMWPFGIYTCIINGLNSTVNVGWFSMDFVGFFTCPYGVPITNTHCNDSTL